MSEPVWDEFLTERDKQVFETSGYGARGGVSESTRFVWELSAGRMLWNS